MRIYLPLYKDMVFPGGSEGKESPCSEETQVQSLGREDPLEEGIATHSILAWRIPWTRSLAGFSPWGGKELDVTERLILSHIFIFQ